SRRTVTVYQTTDSEGNVREITSEIGSSSSTGVRLTATVYETTDSDGNTITVTSFPGSAYTTTYTTDGSTLTAVVEVVTSTDSDGDLDVYTTTSPISRRRSTVFLTTTADADDNSESTAETSAETSDSFGIAIKPVHFQIPFVSLALMVFTTFVLMGL
ncbi:uncharacterized protein ASCRUDRAFT_6064, partial [Ascoidea rubescens DSM 1968]